MVLLLYKRKTARSTSVVELLYLLSRGRGEHLPNDGAIILAFDPADERELGFQLLENLVFVQVVRWLVIKGGERRKERSAGIGVRLRSTLEDDH